MKNSSRTKRFIIANGNNGKRILSKYRPAGLSVALVLAGVAVTLIGIGCTGGTHPGSAVIQPTQTLRALTLGDLWTYDAVETDTLPPTATPTPVPSVTSTTTSTTVVTTTGNIVTTGETSTTTTPALPTPTPSSASTSKQSVVTGSLTVALSQYVAGTLITGDPPPAEAAGAEFTESYSFVGTDANGLPSSGLTVLYTHNDNSHNVVVDGKNSSATKFLLDGLATSNVAESAKATHQAPVASADIYVAIERPGSWPSTTGAASDWSEQRSYSVPVTLSNATAGTETLNFQRETSGQKVISTPVGTFNAYVVQMTRTDYAVQPVGASLPGPLASVTVGTYYYVPQYDLPVMVQESYTNYVNSTSGTRTLTLHSVNFKP